MDASSLHTLESHTMHGRAGAQHAGVHLASKISRGTVAAGSATVERGKIGRVRMTRYFISSSLDLALHDDVRTEC